MSSEEQERIRAAEDRNYRGLWGAVVMQAKTDVETAPISSLEFAHAVAFFTSGGEWAHMRTAIGDFLELHGDDLERLGRRCIDARRQSEGLSPLPPPVPRQPRTTRATPRSPAARPAADQTPAQAARTARNEGRFNPFFPRGVYPAPLASGA